MEFNSYLVELDSKESAVTGKIELDGEGIHIVLKKINKSIYAAHFKVQIGLHFLQKIEITNRKKSVTILLPMLSKYNKRRLLKLSKLLDDPTGRDKAALLLNLLSVEKILQVDKLMDFFSLKRKETIAYLVSSELEKKIKVIEYLSLTIVSYSFYLNCLKDLKSLVLERFNQQQKTISFNDLEACLKMPRSSFLFMYLLNYIIEPFSLRIANDAVIFEKIAISDKDMVAMEKIKRELKQNKLSIFSLENALKISDLIYKEVNDALWFLVEEGQIVKLNEEYFIFADELNKILNRMKKHKRNQDENIDIQSFREMTAFNRKKLIILFEYFDTQRITERVGNKRKILLGV